MSKQCFVCQDCIHGISKQVHVLNYCNLPKISDAKKLRCKLQKIQTKTPYLMEFRQKGANGVANSEDPDQTAPLGEQSDLGLHCLPRPICLKTLDHYGTFNETF